MEDGEDGEDRVLNSMLITNWEKYDQRETLGMVLGYPLYTSNGRLAHCYTFLGSSQILHRLRLNLSASTQLVNSVAPGTVHFIFMCATHEYATQPLSRENGSPHIGHLSIHSEK